ncbi:hypothetical protein ACFFKH_07455 [Micromonospora marina]|uniref:Uncharacterized protein n=1 Tax=Micromonospora marina TaxID=307120 RepID=A0A1C4VVK9_9ACTN|nr:hypothetical protein [Micromonospora marina]SCE88064.1 hypothetical protein GA0070215_10431 [Micromonospora marina]
MVAGAASLPIAVAKLVAGLVAGFAVTHGVTTIPVHEHSGEYLRLTAATTVKAVFVEDSAAPIGLLVGRADPDRLHRRIERELADVPTVGRGDTR